MTTEQKLIALIRYMVSSAQRYADAEDAQHRENAPPRAVVFEERRRIREAIAYTNASLADIRDGVIWVKENIDISDPEPLF